MYQCRCSFLEIYNEQITDLLDPSQRNLQISEDVNSGVYVENLTEECVSTMKDVTQLLMKGLSNRRTGATSINAESSPSHSVFTCAVKSRCKSVADGLNCFKTSRINLVDLAGSERQKQTGAAGERLKEAGNINRSLSQLGNLINILAEVSQSGKQRHILYRDSRLTFLLQESLGGNAKLAMVCAISPVQSCKSETLSTLRFAQRAKAIKNRAVVNEVMQDDVNFLHEVIRQLKIYSQCNIYEAGQKKVAFKYLTEKACPLIQLLHHQTHYIGSRLWIHLVVILLFGQCHINNNLMHFHPKRFTFQRKRRRIRRRRRTNKEEATKSKSAGKAWYQTMISDSDYTEFENFSKWLGVSQ